MQSPDSQQPPPAKPERVELAITSSLGAGAKLRENRQFSLTPLGVEFRGQLSLDQWREAMAMLAMWRNASSIWLADFVKKGREWFAEAEVAQAVLQLEFSEMEVEKAVAIGEVPGALRSVALHSEHYFVLGRDCKTDALMQTWANLAVEHKLSAHDLQRSIAANKVVKGAALGEGGKGGGLVTIHGFRAIFDRFLKQADKEKSIHDWPDDRKRELFEELKPAAALGMKLGRELGVPLE